MANSLRLGLALSGGAALGVAHIGVIDAITEAGIAADCVAGTSIGAVVGAAYVTGKMAILRGIALEATRWRVMALADPLIARAGLIGGARVVALLEEVFGGMRIEALPLPFAAVAVDLATGREVVMREGWLVPALRASISVPGVFEPVVQGDAVLVDGTLLQPMPVAACHALGAERVVAVDLMADVAGAAEAAGMRADRIRKANAVDVLTASVVVMTGALTRANLAVSPADVLVTPRVGKFAPHHFHRGEELIRRGHAAGRAALPAIRACLERDG